MSRWRHWLGSPTGALWYFGTAWGLILLYWFWFWWTEP